MPEDKPMLTVLDLFSGILVGGFSLGLERTGGFRTVAFCEIEPFPRRVLAKHWPEVPIYEDVRNLKGSDVGPVDVICGGYPCQPFSYAGVRKGADDDRHLWPEYLRLISELRPSWVIGENVAGHITMGLDQVLSDLESADYTARAFVIPAVAVNAPHRRDRVWIIGNANQDSKPASAKHDEARRMPRLVADAYNLNEQGQQSSIFDAQKRARPIVRPIGPCSDVRGWWETEPGVGRVAHGVPDRSHRLAALGNSVVPQIPELIGRAILEAVG